MTIVYLQIALLKQQIYNIILQISLNDVQARLITSTGVLAFRKCIMIRKGAFLFCWVLPINDTGAYSHNSVTWCFCVHAAACRRLDNTCDI